MLCRQAFLDVGPALRGRGGNLGPCPAEQFSVCPDWLRTLGSLRFVSGHLAGSPDGH